MCGTFGQDKDENAKGNSKWVAKITKEFREKHGTPWKPVVKPNQTANIYTSKGLTPATFGFILGEFKDGRKKFWINARVEYFDNSNNSTSYHGPFEIFKNKEIAPLLKTSRAVIPVSHFFESPSNNIKQKFLIKPANGGVIYLGGVYTQFIDADSGELSTPSFCILTTASNKATSAINHARCPLIIEEADIENYLNPILTEKQLSKYFKPNNNQDYSVIEIDAAQLKDNNLFTPESLSDFNAISEPIII